MDRYYTLLEGNAIVRSCRRWSERIERVGDAAWVVKISKKRVPGEGEKVVALLSPRSDLSFIYVKGKKNNQGERETKPES